MDTSNCRILVKSYFLYQNPLYAFSFPISLIVGIVVYGICVSMKCSTNSYLLQIVYPVLAIILSNMILIGIAEMMIDQNQLNETTNEVCSHLFRSVENFQSAQQEQTTQEEQKQVVQQKEVVQREEIHSPLPLVDNLYNSTSQVINEDPTPYRLPYTGLNSQSLCQIK